MSFIKGMDVSMLKELEQAGAAYYDNGEKKELLQLLKEYGTNLIRLRLWNDPYDEKGNPYGGGTNDKQSVFEMAGRIKEKGLQFMLDFHYSDFWTDPKKQMKPKAWENLGGDALGQAVYEYTYETLEELKKKDIMPQIVQIGNEITNGFLWPDGQLPIYHNLSAEQEPRDYTRMFTLLQQGIRAVRKVDRTIRVMIHLDFGGDHGLYRSWFDEAQKYGLDYDIIGLSYYPYWHSTLKDLSDNLNDISRRYDKDVLIAETAYGFTLQEGEGLTLIFSGELADSAGYPPTPQGQTSFLKDLTECIRGVENGRGMGFVYWEPAWIPTKGTTWAAEAGQIYAKDIAPGGNSWANQALFDYQGNALQALHELKDMK